MRPGVRDPRTGIDWSPCRVAIRARYGIYMSSSAWFDRRRLWAADWRAMTGRDPFCFACEGAWELRHGDLHHRSYERLGEEELRDLVPLCRPCHTLLHAILERSPSYRQLRRERASDLIVARIRAEHRKEGQ